MAYRDAIVYVAQVGADTYTQTLNGVLYTEKQIGFMADRILYTEGQIADMADRIVYVTELSQNNTIVAMYMVVSLAYLGIENGMNMYDVTVSSVDSIPWI